MAGIRNTAMESFEPPSAGDPVLTEVVRRLVDAYHPLRVYLFGSTARGDAGTDSDYDFMVVVSDDAPPELQDCKMGYRALSGLGIAKDILVWTRNEFDKRLHLKASMPSTVVEEGKLLYGA
jgi:predicted nucleotidyltransferase